MGLPLLLRQFGKVAADNLGFKVDNLITDPRFSSYSHLDSKYGQPPAVNSRNYQYVYEMVTTVYRSVRVIASNLAALPVKIEDIQIIDGKKQIKDITYDKEFDIFRKYNDLQDAYTFWEYVYSFYALNGELPILKNFKSSKISELFNFNPDFIRPVAVNEFTVDHYLFYGMNGNTIKIPLENILFLKTFNPLNPLRGLSPLSAASEEISLDMSTVESSKKMYENGARPSGVMSTESSMNPDEWEIFKKTHDKLYGGEKAAGKIMYMPNGFKWQPMSLSSRDMELIKQRLFTKDSIREVYGISPIFYGDLSQSSKISNTEEQKKITWESCFLPYMRKITGFINEFLMKDVTDNPNAVFSFDTSGVEVLQSNKEQAIKIAKTGFSCGALSPNDITETVFGLPRDRNPELDKKYLPYNLTPVGEAIKEDTNKSINELQGKLNKLSGYDDLITKAQNGIKEIRSKQKESFLIVKANEVAAQINPIINKYEQGFITTLKGLFKSQKKEVLGNINSQKFYRNYQKIIKAYIEKVDLNIAASQFNFAEWVDKFAAEGEYYIAGALGQAAMNLAESMDTEFDLIDPVTVNKIGGRVSKYSTIVNQTTKDAIDKILVQSVVDNLTIEEAAGLISDYFDTAEGYRAIMIARTEIVGGTNLGRLESMRQGNMKYHTWVTQRDGEVRSNPDNDHTALEGTTVKVGDRFPVGSGYVGDPTYPSDIRERCSTFPRAENV